MSQCDLCRAKGNLTFVGASQLREAVFDGTLQPGDLGFETTAAYVEWKDKEVALEVGDWHLCERCYTAIAPHFAGDPAPIGVSKGPSSRRSTAGVLICPKCKTKLKHKAMSCGKCGHEILASSEVIKYFEVPSRSGDGVCSDPKCPCPEVKIRRGEGYLYVSAQAVDFRQDSLTLQDLKRKIARLEEATNHYILFDADVAGAILMCEAGAQRRKLDLAVAAADAKHWWETGLVPLRATPFVGQPQQQPLLIEKLEATRIPCPQCGYMTLPRIIEETGGVCKRCHRVRELAQPGTLFAIAIPSCIVGAIVCVIIGYLLAGQALIGALVGVALGFAFAAALWTSLQADVQKVLSPTVKTLDEVCWYCDFRAAETDSFDEVQMYVSNRFSTGPTDATIQIPRCATCKSRHERGLKFQYIGAGLGLGLGIILMIRINWGLWIVAVLMAAVGLWIGSMIGRLAARGTKGFSAAKEFPNVRDKLRQGWEMYADGHHNT